MLRIYVATRDEYDQIWMRLMPQARRTADWTGTDSLILNDHDGPILVTIGETEVVKTAPDRVKQLLTVKLPIERMATGD